MLALRGSRLKRRRSSCEEGPAWKRFRSDWLGLPPELLLRIFSWLSPRDLYSSVAPVCKAWRQLSRDVSLWSRLSFQGDEVNTNVVCAILTHSPRLQFLELVDRNDAGAILHQVAKTNRQLRVLTLKRCRGTSTRHNIPAGILINIIKQCSSISELNLKETQFRSTRFYKLLGQFLPSLRRVNFAFNDQFGSTALRSIVKGCSRPLEEFIGFRSLSSHSRYPLYGDEDVKLLCTSMGKSLRVLKLNAQGLSDTALHSITTECRHLEVLQVRCAVNLTFAGIMEIPALQNLVSFTISVAIDIPTVTWCELFNTGQWQGLKTLGLSLCYHVEDQVLQSISTQCRNLEKLKLTGCVRVTSNGLRFIFSNCNKLRHLNLMLMQKQILAGLSLIPDYLPNLETLTFGPLLQEDLISETRTLADVRRRLPHLTIHVRQ